MIKAILFDFDGTLADTLPLCLAAFSKAFDGLTAEPVTDDQILATFGPSEEATVKALLPAERYDEGIEGYWREYAALHSMAPEPFPGVREMLASFRERGVMLGLVTGKGKRSADISMERLDLAKYFDDFEYGWVHGVRKAEAIRAMLGRHGIAVDEAVYVGDYPSDVTAAREAGVRMAAVAWAGTAEPGKLLALRPDWVFYSIEEFSACMSELIK